MNSDNNVPKAKFTDHLKALLLGGAIAAAAAQSASAANLPAAPSKDTSLDARVERIRQQMTDAQSNNDIRVGNGSQGTADVMWWRNAWGNGGWHNWHNGWRNGGPGGWGNWHNW